MSQETESFEVRANETSDVDQSKTSSNRSIFSDRIGTDLGTVSRD